MRHLQVREKERNGYEGMLCINQKTCTLAFFKSTRYHSLYGAHNTSHLDMMIKSQYQKNCSRFCIEKLLENVLFLYFFRRPPVKMPRKTGAAADVHLLLLLLGMMMLVLVVTMRL